MRVVGQREPERIAPLAKRAAERIVNGRRLANFASPGDSVGVGVDLNNIPATALRRVEVLKDGASAIYGTDAIGGVMDFITRKDHQGVDLGVSTLGGDPEPEALRRHPEPVRHRAAVHESGLLLPGLVGPDPRAIRVAVPPA